MLDDLLTLAKLSPVSERVLHLQVELGPGGGVKGEAYTHTYVHSKVTSSRRKGQAGLVDVAVCHLVAPARNICSYIQTRKGLIILK